jgi:hypothetical protein
MQTIRIPLAIRLAGLWLLWSAWCQCCGWGLSAAHWLTGWGYLAALPILIVAGGWWFKTTAAGGTKPPCVAAVKWRRRFSQPLPMIYLGIVALSLASALLYTPWSFDAVSYRLPRLLYWHAAHHWYWIGTLDHRLDYSSCGFEWQMLPVMLITRTDRLIFLLSWLPFLLMPGLVFYGLRMLGVNSRSARRWMWLLPSGFCYALQCSGLQNDGYMVGYTLAVIVFAGLAWRLREVVFLWMALLAAALLTGAKLSNLPLLLPLGLLLLPALCVVRWFNWRTALIVIIAAICSFAPLAFFCWKYTGSWTGDPTDQWDVRPHSDAGAFVGNSIAMGYDIVQPPLFPVAQEINARLEPLDQSAFMRWVHWAEPDSLHLDFGNMPYEGQAGLGCGLGFYGLFLLLGCWFVKPVCRAAAVDIPWAWRLAPWSAWLALGVVMATVGFAVHIPRYAASYYPLLFVSILSLPRIAAMERRKIAAVFSGIAMLAVVPVILLTPARPLVPVERLAKIFHRPALQTLADQYHFWAVLRDDLAPMRNHLPPDATRVGYAAGFRDTSYGLWKPFGSRQVMELGLPLGSHSIPPADVPYAVVTERGLQQRYDMDLKTWLNFTGGHVVFEQQRDTSLVAHSEQSYDTWYLVEFAPIPVKTD